jgi:hypothetical protein
MKNMENISKNNWITTAINGRLIDSLNFDSMSRTYTNWDSIMREYVENSVKNNPLDEATLQVVSRLVQDTLLEILNGDLELFVSKLAIKKVLSESEIIKNLQEQIQDLKNEIALLKTLQAPLSYPNTNVTYSRSPYYTTYDSTKNTPDETTPKTL